MWAFTVLAFWALCKFVHPGSVLASRPLLVSPTCAVDGYERAQEVLTAPRGVIVPKVFIVSMVRISPRCNRKVQSLKIENSSMQKREHGMVYPNSISWNGTSLFVASLPYTPTPTAPPTVLSASLLQAWAR